MTNIHEHINSEEHKAEERLQYLLCYESKEDIAKMLVRKEYEIKNLIKYLEEPIDTTIFNKGMEYARGYMKANKEILKKLKENNYD